MLRRCCKSFLICLHLLTTGVVLAADKPQAQGVKNQIEVLGGIPVLTIDGATNAGSVWLSLRNSTKKEIPVFLSMGDFSSETTKRTMSPKVTFSREGGAGSSFYKLSAMKPDSILFLKVEVSGIWEAGESSAPVFNGGVKIGTIRALKYGVPFTVSIEAKDPQKPEVSLRRGDPALLVFKNSDAIAYPIRWELFIPGEATLKSESDLILPPTSVIPVSVFVPESWFTQCFTGFFKKQERDALLTMRLSLPDTTANSVLPVKTIPLRLSLEYWSDGTDSFLGNLILILFLAAGGVTSLFLNLWIPNKLRRIDLSRKLENLQADIRSISVKTDSMLRVALRVQRLRLQETLQSLRLFSPGLSAVLDNFEKDIVTLSRRVEVTKQFDDVLGHLEVLRGQTESAPPTLLDEVMERLDKAADLLKKGDIVEIEFQKAQALMLDAHQRLENITAVNVEFAKSLSAHVKKLRIAFDENSGSVGSQNKCKEIRAKMPDEFAIIKDAQYEDDSAISPEQYHWIDLSVQKLRVLRHFIIRLEDNQNDAERKRRIEACEERLLKLLKLQNWNSLQLARRIRREIEQDIFSSNVINALKEKQMGVRIEPLQPALNEPVQLMVHFINEMLNSSAAREDYTCIWDFGDVVGKEVGWEISHYFRNAEESHPKIMLMSTSYEVVDGQIEATIDIKPLPKKKSMDDRWKVELANISIAMAVAILGLVAGAREQILKLDMFAGLIAVFSLGFGADTVKNLIAKRP